MAKRTSSTAQHAKATAREGTDVRDRISRLTTDALRDRKLKLRDLPALASEVMDGAVEGVKEAMPESRTSVLRQVVEGLGDAYEAAAGAAASTARSTRRRGSEFIEKDVRSVAHDLRGVQRDVFDAVSGFGHRLSDELARELKSVVSTVRRARVGAAPGVRSAASAADGRLVELTGEVATTGVRIARRAAGTAMSAASGLLDGLAASVAPKPARPAKPAPKRKRAAKTAKKAGKATGKKAAKKRSARGRK